MSRLRWLIARPITATLVVAFIAWTLCAQSQERPDGRSWPVARGNVFGTGVAVSELPDKLDVLWTFKIDKTGFEATPAIADGMVFLGDVGTGDATTGKMFAFDLKTGDVKWKFDGAKLGFVASPAYRNGKVYAGDGEGTFFCLDAKSGKELWRYAMDAEIAAGANFVDDKVLVGCQDAHIYCLNADDGKEIWKQPIANQIRTFTTIDQGKAFVCQCDGTMHIMDVATGKIDASHTLGPPGNPIANLSSTPVVWKHMLIFGTEQSGVMCLDWGKPATPWTYELPTGSQSFKGSAAVDSTLAVIGGRAKIVVALDPATGTEKWKFTGKAPTDSSPVIVGKRVFIGMADGRLYALDRDTGKELWQYQARGEFKGDPAVADGRLVIATDKGMVYCFGKKE
jgi:outer membrane protein assembly factor BamB